MSVRLYVVVIPSKVYFTEFSSLDNVQLYYGQWGSQFCIVFLYFMWFRCSLNVYFIFNADTNGRTVIAVLLLCALLTSSSHGNGRSLFTVSEVSIYVNGDN